MSRRDRACMAQAFHGTVWIRPVAGSAAALIRALGVVASRLLEQMGSRTRVASACVTPALILCMLAMLASPIILHTTAPSTRGHFGSSGWRVPPAVLRVVGGDGQTRVLLVPV